MAWIGFMLAGLLGFYHPTFAQTTVSGHGSEAVEPLSVMVFSDFSCGPCAQVGPIMARLKAVYPGPVQVLFKHSPRSQDGDVWLLHEAALAAETQGRFREMHDLIFAAEGLVRRREVMGFAHRLGLDMQAFAHELDTHRHRPRIERDVAEARALWVEGTPAVFINGIDLVGIGALAQFVESLAGQADPTSHRPDVRDAPSIGPDGAPVTVVSFVDLRCGFCARGWPAIAELVARYNGRVRWVFKHFPLEMHADALLAHQAAQAAGAQNRFWEMATRILNYSGQMQRAQALAFARELEMDLKWFDADLNGGHLQSAIERDLEEGRALGVQGTPTFFVNGRMRVGMQALERAVAEILASRDGHWEKENNLWLDLEPAFNGGGGTGAGGDSARH